MTTVATTKSQIGDVNRNGQRLLAMTDRPATTTPSTCGSLRVPSETRWGECGGHRYGVNGSDFFQRKCPVCQDGRSGLPIES